MPTGGIGIFLMPHSLIVVARDNSVCARHQPAIARIPVAKSLGGSNFGIQIDNHMLRRNETSEHFLVIFPFAHHSAVQSRLSAMLSAQAEPAARHLTISRHDAALHIVAGQADARQEPAQLRQQALQ